MTLFCMLNSVVPSDKKLTESPPTKHIYHMAALMLSFARIWGMPEKHGRVIFSGWWIKEIWINILSFVSWPICSVTTILIAEPASTGHL